MGDRFIFDIETIGLLPSLTKKEDLLIIVGQELNTGESFAVKLDECEEFARRLYKADQLIGHNIFGFDLPALQKTLGWWDRLDDERDFDTLIATRLIWSNLYEDDLARAKANPQYPLPKNMYGQHSLKAWGIRTGTMKDDFAGDFSLGYTDEMFEYAKQDVVATRALWDLIQEQNYSDMALDGEMAFARLMAEQEATGFPFSVEKAEDLVKTLTVAQAELHQEIAAAIPPWVVEEPFTPRANNSKLGYAKGVPTVKRKTIVFNPTSRDHISDRMKALYGWKPSVFTPNGKPKVDENVLMELDYPIAQLLAKNFLLSKRLSQLATGNQAWMKKEINGKIHGKVITNGAVTGRCTHASPNVAQVPSTRAWYGTECRELFTAPEGRVLVGSDASGLELRVLAHFLSIAGDPSYAEEVVNGDVHTRNQQMAGLPTRDAAKTFIYALLYGAGDELIGKTVGGGRGEGRKLKTKFFDSLPALRKLVDACKSKSQHRGYLIGIDGRRLHSKSPHSSLNLLLQSAGALVCKNWAVQANRLFKERNLDVQWHAAVHDEYQVSCPKDQADLVGAAFQDAMRLTQTHYNIKCQLDTDFNVGSNWAQTH